ncbi:toxin-antitoxin system, toxin component, RelE family [Escherichia coli T426]|nr:toxin-antitoxin system, toxin component, RelE family [Escherichia coli T426]
MMDIFWTMLASQDRKRIREYIAEQNLMAAIELDEPRQPDGCKLKTAPVRPVVAARPVEYVCSEDLFY